VLALVGRNHEKRKTIRNTTNAPEKHSPHPKKQGAEGKVFELESGDRRKAVFPLDEGRVYSWELNHKEGKSRAGADRGNIKQSERRLAE